MNIKTITTVDGVNVVDFGSAASRFYWIENLGSTVVYVSGNENIVPDGDNVKVLSAGCGTMIENLGGKVYILGAGKFQITNQGDKFPPFRNAPVADGGMMASGNPVQIDGLQGGVPFSEITVIGKNLIPSDYMTKSGTYNGVTVTVKNDGRFDVNGTPTQSFTVLSFAPSKYYLKGGKKYTFNCSHIYNVNTFNIFVRVFNKYGEQIKGILSYPTTITANDGDYFVWSLWAVENYEISATDVEVQLEYGTVATEYEPPITGRDLTVNVNGAEYTITPDSNPYTVPNDIRQVDGLNNISVSEGELSVTGVRKNAAVKKIWDKLDELTTAIIVSNGETIE